MGPRSEEEQIVLKIDAFSAVVESFFIFVFQK